MLCQLSAYAVTLIPTAALLATGTKLGHRDTSGHITRTWQSLDPNSRASPPLHAASGFSIFAKQDLCFYHFLLVVLLPRASTVFLGKDVPTFYSLIIKFHSSQLASPLLAVKMKSHLSRFWQFIDSGYQKECKGAGKNT